MEGRDPRRQMGWIALAAALAGLVRLPFLGRPLSSDEGGYLMVAAQWHPGTSLYGNYWVDRPPLLIALFRLADWAGGTVPLRLLGVVIVVGSVLLAAWIGRLAAPGTRAPVYAAVTAAVFASTPLFDAQEVDGELLTLPFLLAGTGCVLAALSRDTRHPWRWWLAAGALAASAALVKQNMLDVAVVAATALVYRVARPAGRSRRTALGESVRGGLLFLGGAMVVVAAALTVADALGTHPSGLWNALVEFRVQASRVIARSSGDHVRLLGLLGVFLLSGAPVLVGALVVAAVRRRRERLREPAGGPVPVALLAGAVLAWEAVAIAGGGSYWWHYQMASLTGLVLAAVALSANGARTRRTVRITLAYAAAVTLGFTVFAPTWAVGPKADPPVVHFLRAHKRPGDTGAVAFGDPAILRASGLSSPYPQLWSLPVKVRDPHLSQFAKVLRSPQRPTWIVSFHRRLGTWGANTSAAETALRQHYTRVARVSGFHIFESDTAVGRSAAPPSSLQPSSRPSS